MPNFKKKNKRRNTQRPAPVRNAITAPKTSNKGNNTASTGFKYGHVLVDLLLDFVSPFDLLLLRSVSWRSREYVDSRIFKHVTLKTDTETEDGTRVIPVATETGQRLPTPALTSLSPEKSILHFFGYLDLYTTVLDLENLHPKLLKRLGHGMDHLNRVEVLRLRSDNNGYHTYSHLYEGFGASTIVAFPSFYPFLGWDRPDEPAMIPDGATKIVQHIAFAVDWRGSVLFDSFPVRPCNLEEEVWIMTHAQIKADYGHFNLWDDRVLDTNDDLHEQLMREIAVRLKAGISLTIIGWESVTDWGYVLFGIMDGDFDGPEDDEQIQKAIRSRIPLKKKRALSNLHFKTLDEYAAMLSPEELENERLPPSYLERWRALQAERYKGEPNPTPDFDFPEEWESDYLDESETEGYMLAVQQLQEVLANSPS